MIISVKVSIRNNRTKDNFIMIKEFEKGGFPKVWLYASMDSKTLIPVK